jgi:hypothetical protein
MCVRACRNWRLITLINNRDEVEQVRLVVGKQVFLGKSSGIPHEGVNGNQCEHHL